MPFAPLACWFAVILAATSCGAAEPQREFEVFVPVVQSSSNKVDNLVPGSIIASLGSRPLTVLSVQGRDRASRTPLVVVLDLLHTEDRQKARAAAEVLPLLPELRRRHATVISTAVTKGLVETVDLGSGHRVSLVSLGPGRDLETTARDCRARSPACPQLTSASTAFGVAILPALSRAFDASQGPVRVFWVAGDQFWWDAVTEIEPLRPMDLSWPRQAPEDYSQRATRSPDPLATNAWTPALPNISEAGMAVFPVFMPDAVGSDRRPDREARYAQSFAAFMGGRCATATAKPGEALLKLLEMTDNGLVIRLSGPVTGFVRGTGLPRKLKIQSTDPAFPLRFERPFVINAPGFRRDESLLERAAVPVVLPSEDVRLEPGCGTRLASADDLRVTIRLPDAVMAAPAGRLDTYLEYSDTAGKTLAQRLAVTRPQRRGPAGAQDGVCLPLSTGSVVHGELKFRLVVMDETTGWVGAVSARMSQ